MKYLILTEKLESWEKTFLIQLISQSKIALSDCHISSDRDILKLIQLAKPEKIVAMSEFSLTQLTGKQSIEHWRGSQLEFQKIPVIPMYNIQTIARMYKNKLITLRDFSRLKENSERPKYNFILNPSFQQIIETLEFLKQKTIIEPLECSIDIETGNKTILCIGLAWTLTDAICIPFVENGFIRLAQEDAIILRMLYELMTHRNFRGIFQNGLFDLQYIHEKWMFIPHIHSDTMITHHSMFSQSQKSLDFIASFYCDFYQQWKPQKKKEFFNGE